MLRGKVLGIKKKWFLSKSEFKLRPLTNWLFPPYSLGCFSGSNSPAEERVPTKFCSVT